jgi:hypothetical protein
MKLASDCKVSFKKWINDLFSKEKKISFADPSILQREINYVIDSVKKGLFENHHHTSPHRLWTGKFLDLKLINAG